MGRISDFKKVKARMDSMSTEELRQARDLAQRTKLETSSDSDLYWMADDAKRYAVEKLNQRRGR